MCTYNKQDKGTPCIEVPHHSLYSKVFLDSLYCAHSFTCKFSNVTDRVTTFQITDNVVIFFFLLFNSLNGK